MLQTRCSGYRITTIHVNFTADATPCPEVRGRSWYVCRHPRRGVAVMSRDSGVYSVYSSCGAGSARICCVPRGHEHQRTGLPGGACGPRFRTYSTLVLGRLARGHAFGDGWDGYSVHFPIKRRRYPRSDCNIFLVGITRSELGYIFVTIIFMNALKWLLYVFMAPDSTLSASEVLKHMKPNVSRVMLCCTSCCMISVISAFARITLNIFLKREHRFSSLLLRFLVDDLLWL